MVHSMSKKKSLFPTVTSSIGMLAGGFVGLGVGALWDGELVVLVGFSAGFLLGAVLGAVVGYKILAFKASRR